MTATPVPSTDLAPGDKLHGFTVQRVIAVPDVRALAIECEHERSGAKLLHLLADDDARENLLAIALRTPPYDHTGLPHILEHTVLCGSKRYPVKDPFVELLRSSLATFLNAMTGQDMTVYPCASTSEKDFFNLAGVYCDAVFFPNLTQLHFKQEGHHLDFAEPGNVDAPLVVRGIVYNEMKGAFSDLNGIMGREISRAICPDNAYGMESGGRPEHIPELTYREFVAFHRRYYHPANARIFVYGPIATRKHLEFLDRVCLSHFERIAVDTTIAEQPRWSQPQRFTRPYPLGAAEDEGSKTAVILSLLTNDLGDAVTTLAMDMLEDYLLGNAGSPLRKALIDSKLGQELTPAGYAAHRRDTYFVVGLKGSEPDRADAIEKLVFDTLRRIADQGLETPLIESAFHRLEIGAREIGSGYPLRLMGRVYHAWLYDQDPLHHLRISEHLASLRERYRSEPGFFENLIRRWLIDNPHYVRITYVPDKAYNGRLEAEESAKMAALKQTLSREQLERVAAEATELERMQAAPNPPEALATLPRLKRDDVPPDSIELDTHESQHADVTVLHTAMFTGGLNYLALSLDLAGIDDELVDYLPLYAAAVTEMGAGGDDFAAMARREAACSGGVGASGRAGCMADEPRDLRLALRVGASALDRKFDDMLRLVGDRLLLTDLTDHERFRDIVQQGKINRRSGIIPNGSAFAASYAAQHLSRLGALGERLGGLSQVRLFDRMADAFDQQRDALLERLQRIAAFVQGKAALTVSFVGPEAHLLKLEPFLSRFSGTGARDRGALDAGQGLRDDLQPATQVRQGIATPAEVAFVARAMNVVAMTDPLAPALHLLSLQLSYGYLWEQIRVKGGAYGAKARYDGHAGVFSLSSYRDPFIKQTLDAYDGIVPHVTEQMDLSADGLGSAIVGSVKTLDQPIRPPQAAGVALGRYLSGETPRLRRQFRDRLLNLSADDVRRAAADLLGPALPGSPICVLSSREKLAAANAKLGAQALVIEDL